MIWLMVLLSTTQAWPQSAGPQFPNPGKTGMSREDQHALGLQAAAEVYKQMPVLPDSSPETQYIRRLGQKLVATIPPEYSWPFEFHVVAQKEINAFALPGGPMFVNIGTITAAASEAELAGVMGHEMAHVYMQHSAKQAGKAQWTQGLAGLASGVLGATTGGMVGQLAQYGIQFGAQGLMLKYSRSDESQADAVGTIILYKAGYNPQAMANFFKTLESEGGGSPPQWLSDHPNPGNRQIAIEKEISNWPAVNYAGESAAFQKVRQHAASVKAYTGQEIAAGAKSGQWAAINQKNGAALSAPVASAATGKAPVAAVSLESVLPSQQMVATDLRLMKIARPNNWSVTMPQQQGDYVTIAPKAGVTSNGVGYGVLINAAKSKGQGMSLDEITTQLIQDMQRTAGVKPVSKAQAIGVNGIQGRSVMMQSVSPISSAQGEQVERDWLVAIPHENDTVIFFIFVAPQSEFDRFRPTYEAMLKSVKF
ncbi:MAG TPA: M48 family metallopeptidase [Terriglobales bacterium]|nr:M48 family metallopeptidase [Terriglobales bacterium]